MELKKDGQRPRLLITLGDAAGIGPEIVAAAWKQLQPLADVVVIGDPAFLPDFIPSVKPSAVDLSSVRPGKVSAEAGRAAYEWLVFAIDECLAGRADGIVTCPLHKEGLAAAGVQFPGHTEILADRTRSSSHAMLLYDDSFPLAVAHVTLHQSLRSVFKNLTSNAIVGKIRLLNKIVPQLTGMPARIAVAALNPHASDGGLFGDEEHEIITPAIRQAVDEGIEAIGPIAADAIFLPFRAQNQDPVFIADNNPAKPNGIVAMYHDQGHIGMKLLGGRRAVNVTAGLPIVRTSVAHGTAYDIVGKGVADASSLVSAVRVAARLVKNRHLSL